ncbi:MAG: cupin domain-containing protein [Caulobacteraceae bacterium]
MELTSPEKNSWRSIREGVDLAPLKMSGGAGSFLLRFAPGTRSPSHIHPGGEEIYVISGSGRLDDLAFQGGDFIYTPPGESHTLFAETEVLIHVALPEPVVITE